MPEVDEVRSYGLSSVPIGWVPTKYQGVVEALRRLHLGQGDSDAVRDALDAMAPQRDYDVDDLALGQPLSAVFTTEADGLHVYVESPGSVGLPNDAVVWSFGDGTPSVRKAAKVAHRYARPGRFLIQCDVSVAGNTFNEMNYVSVELQPVERDEPAEATADLPVEFDDYDPNDHDAADVVSAISSASADDIAAIVVREREGQNRDEVLFAALTELDSRDIADETEAALPDDRFDPSDYAVDDVEDHLKANDAAEAARVLGLEQLGKNRKGVIAAAERRIVKGDD